MTDERKEYARCAACNTPFYPYFEPKVRAFEDLCSHCKNIAMSAAYDTYEDSIDEIDNLLACLDQTELEYLGEDHG